MANDKKVRGKPLVKAVVVAIILVLASVLGININDLIPVSDPTTSNPSQTVQSESGNAAEGELILTMIDVGQADSFLLEQNGVVALIDCGTASAGDDVVKYLQEKGITRIDYVIGTHPHDDHMGGMYEVITNFEVGIVVIPEVTTMKITTAWYTKLMKEIKTGGYTVDYPEVNEVYTLGNATMKVLGPIEEPKSNKNNYSIILKVTFGEMDVIMTGDAETSLEKDVLESGADLDAEILKVGHHGSDTSSSDEFLDAVSPEYALISAGLGNKHEHPIKSIMEKLEGRKIEVYRTDESGTVVVTITSNDAEFSVEPGDYLSGVELEERESK